MAAVHENTSNMRSSELPHLCTAVHSKTEDEQVEPEILPEDNEDRDTRQDLQQFGIYRALPVYGQPDFSTKEPQSAEEYIRRVRLSTQITAAELNFCLRSVRLGWSEGFRNLYAVCTLNSQRQSYRIASSTSTLQAVPKLECDQSSCCSEPFS